MPCRICKQRGHNARTHHLHLRSQERRLHDAEEACRELLLPGQYRQADKKELSSDMNTKKESCDCPICMEPIGDKNKFVTACGHTFCGTCILTNYQRNTSCPLCRGEIAPNVNFEPAKTKFKRLLAPRELMDIIHDRLGKTLDGVEETLLKVAEQESAGETTPSLSMSLAQPILRGLLRYTQEIHDHVVENV